MDARCGIGFEGSQCEETEDKSFCENRMGIGRGGSQGQTSRFVMLVKEKLILLV